MTSADVRRVSSSGRRGVTSGAGDSADEAGLAPGGMALAPGARRAARLPASVLVSARVDEAMRAGVAHGDRPCPEYLLLESEHGIRIIDWTAVLGSPSSRSLAASLRHTLAGLWRSLSDRAILSDGEHLGIPIAAALALRPRRPAHALIGHHLTTPAKRRLLSLPLLLRGVDLMVVHSQAQVDLLVRDLRIAESKVRLVPYGVDTDFWSPRDVSEQRLIVSAGLEHRDYNTLAQAIDGLDVRAHIADGSAHSPAALRSSPASWPAGISRGAVAPRDLRALYAAAALVVVPVVETDFPAGITVVAEAMAMGKAVVVTATSGMRGALPDRDAVVAVPVGDPSALRSTISGLLDDPDRRRSLGERARRAALEHHDVRSFSTALADALDTLGAARDRRI